MVRITLIVLTIDGTGHMLASNRFLWLPRVVARQERHVSPAYPPGSMAMVSSARSRSISPENRTGEPGAGGMATEGTGAHAARDLGRGWKVSPSIEIGAGVDETLAEIAGPGTIRHVWLTTHRDHWRQLVLRMYWEGQSVPAVEVPVGDFFCSGWGEF